MTPERLAQIRRYCAPSCDDEYLSMPDKWLRELLAHVDDLTRQLDDARRLALPAFTSAEGDLSEYTHVLDEPEPLTVRQSIQAFGVSWSDMFASAISDRPSAYDMPVGSVVVVGHDYDGEPQTYTRCHADDNGGWARWSTDPGDLTKPATIRSGWIEGLFSDGLVTEWRLPDDTAKCSPTCEHNPDGGNHPIVAGS